MKNTMKKILAGLLAVCCVPVTGISAAAKKLPGWYGETQWDAFTGEEPIDDHGMLTGEDGLLFEGLRYEDEYFAYLLEPRRNQIKFYPQEDADIDAVAFEVAEVLDVYFPGIKDSLSAEEYAESGNLNFQTKAAVLDGGSCWTYPSGEKRRIFDGFSLMLLNPLPENTAELEANILRDLAKKHLITAYYGFGSTAMYSEVYFNPDPLDGIALKDGQQLTEETAESIQAYLDEQHPGYQVEHYIYQYEEPPGVEPPIIYSYERDRITGAEALSFREKIELGGELYEHCDVVLTAMSPTMMDEKSTLGRNLLEKQGDVTLDTELTIVDVIALNKNLMVGEPLCDTAKKNADVDGDGTPDERDSLAILKEVVELTQDFEEPEKG